MCNILHKFREGRQRDNAAAEWIDLDLPEVNRILRGEDPYPPKKERATSGSWNTQRMSGRVARVRLDVKVSAAAMQAIEMGHIPEDMEDHWFMYCEDGHCMWFRSWTGTQIFDASYRKDGDGFRLTRLAINRNPEEYSSTDKAADTGLFLALMSKEAGVGR